MAKGLAELYLNYAEALIETGNPANYSIARNYIDKVRVRAGIAKSTALYRDIS